MQFTTLFTVTMATLVSTASAVPKPDTYLAEAFVYAINKVDPGYKSVDVPFGKLTHIDYKLNSLELRGIGILLPKGQELDPEDVTCQMYKDALGTQPVSAAFRMRQPAEISPSKPVTFGWVLCYVNVDDN
ncbi:hypothetical protein FIE12Z_8019 [Fusarium flagelliforme]|uniref:Uncharacterized protein n=2 Tax=Fusarium flagelliforme TaxID=2675880 RepID=A0A395MJ99_9HYPO|nr:hypothetical protein FIE12Z_8019 [Fusarium flagelliforme]